jgi:alcohol dehydrogenase class IV
MDALTHAIEALISGWSTAHTDRLAMAAVAMVYRHLPKAYRDGGDLHAREQMALAASYAGLAFTRTNVGNVHAIAHQLGGRYHTPHGLANAIMLPQVLRFSAPATTAVLARLALRVGLGDPSQAQDSLADQFLDSIEAMNDQLGIPRLLATLREQDIAALAAAACWEADTNYPVPRRMTQADCEAMLRAVLAPQTVARRAPRKKPPNDQAMRR